MLCALLIVTASAGPAWACRYEPVPLSKSASLAELAFIGRVESTADGEASFRVEVGLKGDAKAGATIAIASPATSCGLRFAVRSRWLILANRVDGKWTSSVPRGSRLLTDFRGLQEPTSWNEVARVFSAAQLAPLQASDRCVAARFSLMQFFDRLPRACTTDADCHADLYVDTHACYPPVVSSEPGVDARREPELLRLQAAERAACALEGRQLPACSPQPRSAACVAKRCEMTTTR